MSQQPKPKERLEEFLYASQFELTVPRRFPRMRMKAADLWARLTARVGDFVFERQIETSGHAKAFSHYHPDRVWYQPSGWSYLRRILPRREIDAGDVFLDLGSGKGRVLLQAARCPFARVTGVEISPSLNEIAQANIERKRHKLACENVELVTTDATAYELPDDVTVIYLYYPFVGDTFRRVVDNIVASYRRRPRRIRLIYGLPTMEQEILATGIFRPVRSVRILNSGTVQRLALYEARPAT